MNTFTATPSRLVRVLIIAVAAAGLAAQADPVEIRVDAGNPGPQISRHIYGQFSEHLGRGIYEGIWVGEDSPIPNTGGFRNDVVEALKALQIPVIRWPGGCFADEYRWRDGIGPRDRRPVRVNTHWGGVEETNAFGTHEFFRLVDMLDTEAYIAGNLGGGSPREMADWLAYITSDAKNAELAELRRENGRDRPWDVAFWGVGNESWGCGGNMRPEYYADLYRRFATFLKAPEDNTPLKIASGGYNELTEWTEVLSSRIDSNIDGISHHYYTLPTGKWDTKGSATGFGEDRWISTLRRALKIDEYIRLQKAVLEENDPEGRIGLYFDEWGTWYDTAPGRREGFLYQQNTLRDALVAALHFHAFHRHADRVHMANIAQTVNVLQAMVLTDKEKMLLTPTYHVFRMYIPFQDATHLPLALDGVPQYQHGGHSVPGVSATAARGRGDKLYIGITNLNPGKDHDITITVKDQSVTDHKARILTGGPIDAHNTFEAPDTVKPRAFKGVQLDNGRVIFTLPAKSVMVIELD
jgi:alpha-N-arabinofuranosidase